MGLLLDHMQFQLGLSLDQFCHFTLLSLQIVYTLVKLLQLPRLTSERLIFKLQFFDLLLRRIGLLLQLFILLFEHLYHVLSMLVNLFKRRITVVNKSGLHSIGFTRVFQPQICLLQSDHLLFERV